MFGWGGWGSKSGTINLISRYGEKSCSEKSFSAADIETSPVPITAEEQPGTSKARLSRKRRKVQATTKTAKHIPTALSYKVSSKFPEYDLPVQWFYGEDCISQFIDTLDKIHTWAQPILKPAKKMVRPDDETMAELESRPDCYLCGKALDHTDKHLDHNHETGEVIGYSHPLCNLERVQQNYLPIIFHNLRGFDGHMVVKELAKRKEAVYIIPRNMITYTAFMTKKLRFLGRGVLPRF